MNRDDNRLVTVQSGKTKRQKSSALCAKGALCSVFGIFYV